jgi:predicted phage baseplate assembly protein
MSMFLPQPTLDDTRWSDLVEQGRGLIPVYAPEWTDHNVSDPGITLIDLLAWVAEMQVFQVGQVPPSHIRRFLALVGVKPEPPRSARTVLAFTVPGGAPPTALVAGLACEGRAPDGRPVGFRTLHDIQAVPERVATLTAVGGTGRRDLTAAWLRGEQVAPFGDDPARGAAVEIGFTAPLPAGVPVTLAVATVTGREPAAPARHHDAEIVWEARTEAGHWAPVAVDEDGTRALSRDGRVELTLEAGPSEVVRARYAYGSYDAAPALRDVALNGADAAQEAAVSSRWEIASTAVVIGTPLPGTAHPLGVEVDAQTGAVTTLDVTAESAPPIRILGYRAPAPGVSGELVVAAARLGRSTGDPGQSFTIEQAPVAVDSVRVYAGHGATWRRFTAHDDLAASGPADAHIVLDAETGRVAFGDGWHGVVPREGDLVIAAARSTLAAEGNVRVATVDRITGDAPAGTTVRQPLDATGGAHAETLGEAQARAEALAGATTRAVTSADIEQLVRTTPGTRIARVGVRPELHPAFPCVRAPGIVTVIVVPYLPAGRPVPSPGIRRAVATRLAPHRLVGTRFEVTGPRYVAVSVRATLVARRLAVPADVRRRAADALNTFLDPLRGGPAGTGWPFGRDVVRAEVLQLLDDVADVDHVVELDLLGPDGVSCGNLCLGPLELPDPGEHQVEVVAA